MKSPNSSTDRHLWLRQLRSGEMANRVRAFEWSGTPLGPIEQWPQNLRTAVVICLNSRLPMFIAWEPEWTHIHNDACLRVLGAEHTETLGRSARSVWKENWSSLEQRLRGLRGTTADASNDEIHLRIELRRSGDNASLTWECSPIFGDDGEMTGLLCMANAEAFAALAETEPASTKGSPRRTHTPADTILASVKDFAYAFDLDGRFTYANQPLLDLWGRTLEQAVGQNFDDLDYPPDLAAKLHAQIQQVIRTRQRVVDETPYTSPTGVEGYYQYIFAPVIGANGEVEGVAGSTRDISSFIRASETIRSGEERLRLATESAQLGIWSWNVVEDVVRWENDRPYEIFGIARSSPPITEAQFHTQFLYPEDAIEFAAAVETARETGSNFYFLGRIRRPDGDTRWIELNGRPQRAADGSLQSILGTVADVTSRLFSDEQVRLAAEANAKFRAMFEQSTQFAGLLALDGTVMEANRLCLDACGFTRAEVIGKPFWECGWWNRSPELQTMIRQACEAAVGGQSLRRETEYYLADGSTRVVDLSITPVMDESKNVLFIAPTGIDITERKRAEMALARSQQESERQRRVYEAILTNTPDFAYVIDLQRRFIYANDNLLKMWGRTWDETIGRRFIELGYTPDHAAMHDREVDQVVATKAPIRGEVPFTGTYGRRIYDYIFVPVFGADGEVEAVAGTTRDITDRRQNELERDQLLASERTARSQAERAGRLKDEFLATLSHELRTPLNAVMGWAAILRSKQPTPELLEQGLTVIDRNARLQAQLIADLLDMSRIISGKMRLEVQTVDFPLVIEAALDSVRPAAEAKEVRLQSLIEPLSDRIHGDPSRLQQVIWNLLSNAVKFTPRGGKVQIVLARVDSHLELSVRDTGKGIKPEFLPHVFERFRQADSTSTRSHGGLGLGLAIVKQLVEMHGGTVSATSAGEDQGSTFTVRLPISAVRFGPEDGSGIHPTAIPLLRQMADAPDLSGVRVLVVDDEPDSQEIVRRMLEECRAEVVLARSANQALDMLRTDRVDVILSDIGMPEKDGYEFMQTLRRSGVSTPAAALTAFARSADRTRALNAGYQSHVAKPVEPSELLATVASLARRFG